MGVATAVAAHASADAPHWPVAARGVRPFRVVESLQTKQLNAQLQATRTGVVCALNQLLDLKDLGTGTHSTRLAEWAIRVGRELGLDGAALQDLELAAILHDIGKVGISDAILNKRGPLTDEERDEMRKHPEYGWAALRVIPGFERASLFVLHHHEAVDGTGYPAGLSGDEIPLAARIVAVIDAFDAMVSARPYRRGMPMEQALARLDAAAGRQFDRRVVDAFVRIAAAESADVISATEFR